MDDNPGTSIVFEVPVASYENEEDDEELERRQQEREIQERLQGGELDGILGEEDFQYSSEEDEDEENPGGNMSLTSNARRSSINRRTVHHQQPNGISGPTEQKNEFYHAGGHGANPPTFTPSREQPNNYSTANYSTPSSNMNPPLQILGSVIMPDNGRYKPDQYLPNLPAIADQTLEQINEDYQSSEEQSDPKTPKNPSQPNPSYNMNQYGFMHSLDRFAAMSQQTTVSIPSKLLDIELAGDVSVSIDLDELQKEQANKLLGKQDDEHGLSLKYEELFKEYNKCQMLLKLRGKKLEETSNSAAVMQEDYNRQLRAMSHRLHLADQETEALRRQLDETSQKQRENEERFQQAEKSQRDIQEANGELVKKNALLLSKISELENDVESLNFQISEQQKNDTIETITKRYEMAIEQMRDQHLKESQQYQESLSRCQMDVGRQQEAIKASNLHMSELKEHSSRLEAQLSQQRVKTANDQQMLEKLSTRCRELEERAQLVGTCAKSSEQTEAATIETLKRELDRALEGQSKKRAECQALKEQAAVLSKRLGEDEAMVEKLEKEKQELADELRDTKTWLDNLLAKEEHINSAQATMQNIDLIVEENEKKIQLFQEENAQLRRENEELLSHRQTREAMQQEYFVQINDLKLELANLQTENGKIKMMYLEVCNEKANLEALIKEQYDQEYEKRLAVQLETRLDEERRLLAINVSKQNSDLIQDHKKQIEASRAEVASLQSKLADTEKELQLAKQQHAQVELRLSNATSALGEQLAAQERLLKEAKSEQQLLNKKLEDELLAQKSQLESKISELEQSSASVKSKLESEKAGLLSSLDEAVAAKKEALAQSEQLSERLKLAEEKLLAQVNKLSQAEAASVHLNELRAQLSSMEAQLQAQDRDRSTEREKMKEAYESEFTQLAEKFGAEVKLTARLGEENETLKQHLGTVESQLAELQARLDSAKTETSKALEEKDKECEKVCGQLQQRYQEDYDKFMRDHKAIVQKIIQEKRAEHEAEIEALIRKHEQRAEERDQEEQRLLSQIKELKSAITLQTSSQSQPQQSKSTPRSMPKPVLVDAKLQTDQVAVSEVATSFSADFTIPVREEDLDIQHESKMALKSDYIRQLEEMLQKTDSHFKLEIEKMMLIEDAKRGKLESEVESLRKHLAQVKDRLNAGKSLSCSPSLGHGNDYDEDGTDLDCEVDSTMSSSQYCHSKYSKLRRRLNQKDEEMGTIEQAYRLQIEDLEAKFNRLLDQSRRDLENKERECVKARDELARLRSELTKQRESSDFFRKSLADSEKIIESLKAEMKLSKENHLTEIASAKMREEMEKKSLKIRCHDLEKEIESLSLAREKLVKKSRSEAEEMMSRMREGHEEEMTKMRMRMKDLLKQGGRLGLHSQGVSVQTDLDQGYIEQLIEFKQKHLEVLAQWKATLLDQMDIHSANNVAALQKHLSAEYSSMREKYTEWLIPKAKALLENLGSSEFTINRLASLLELELDSILKPKSLPETLKYDYSASPREPHSSQNTKRSMSLLSGGGKAYMDAKTKSDLISSIAAIKASINSTESGHHRLKAYSGTGIRDLEAISSPKELADDRIPGSAQKDGQQADSYKYTPIRQSMSNLTPRHKAGEIDYLSSSDYTSPYLLRKVNSRERSLSRPATALPIHVSSHSNHDSGQPHREADECARSFSNSSSSSRTSSSISVQKAFKSSSNPQILMPTPAFSSVTLPRTGGSGAAFINGPSSSLSYRHSTTSSIRRLQNEPKKKPFIA